MKRFLSSALVLTMVFLAGCQTSFSPAVTDSAALVPHQLPANHAAPNPYMADCDNSVHNDSYSSDVTNAVLPLHINPVLDTSTETLNPMAPPSAFYDSKQNMITPLLGGVAITDVDGDLITRAGAFVPAQHDAESGSYVVQISYSFVDSEDRIVMPTNHGHIIMVETMDENGAIYPVFQKVFDVDVSALALEVLGQDIDTNLLSIVYDYQGNLWFVTGGFRIYPDRNPAGFLGYISQEYIQSVLNGQEASLKDHVHFYKLAEGEGAENGISANGDGAVILTNTACYMLTAKNGVQVKWRTEYQTNGTNDALEGSEYTGGGLAYGSGTTPTLTRDLVLFTDNLDPVNLIALSSDTGELVASIPVLDGLDESVPVSVENSILVYSGGEDRTSVIVCNWFGAGNAGLSNPDANSSVQSYDNLYDSSWTNEGGKYIAPGVERVDIIKEGGSYTAEKVWFRDDIRDTSMLKLSTATGYLYGYWQNLDTGMWCYEVLDFNTGETSLEIPVSSSPLYNNMAVGMIADVKGNALYCPTNAMEMVRWQDDFVSLPDTPAKRIPLNAMERYAISSEILSPATYLMRVSLDSILEPTTISFHVNGLTATLSDYTLYYEASDGSLTSYDGQWTICDPEGNVMDPGKPLTETVLYEIRLTAEDNGPLDQNQTPGLVKLGILLGQ